MVFNHNVIRVGSFFRTPHIYLEIFELGKIAQTKIHTNSQLLTKKTSIGRVKANHFQN